MAQSESEIIKEIAAHIKSEGGAYKTWYVGISKDGKNRLKQHSVSLKEGEAWWINRVASSDTVARRIEQHFLDLGCDGGDGGGDENSNHVYAYKKTSSTNP